MSLPASVFNTTCAVYTSVGAASPAQTGVPCQHNPELGKGRRVDSGALQWTDTILVNPDVDIRDGCTRAGNADALTYADGYEVAIPEDGGPRFAVVWVEVIDRGLPTRHKKVYLMRSTPNWSYLASEES
jgi:hypothetical protein